MVFLLILFLAAIFFGSISLVPDTLSASELSRRAKRSQSFKTRLRRQTLLPSLIVIVRLCAWIFLVLFVVIASAGYGWFYGFMLSLIAVGLYPQLTRVSLLSSLSTKLYLKAEPYLFIAAEKVPYLWRFFYGRFFETFVGERLFASREELIESIQASRDVLDKDEQMLLVNTLSFRDKKVKEIMTPRTVVQAVKKDEFIGPLVLDELHSLGHGRLPVIDGDLDHVIGILHLRTLLSLDVKKSETAEFLMDPSVTYIHEEDTLKKALTAFIKERSHLFIVVNDQRETVGLITLEDTMEALIGKQIVDEDDVYDNMRDAANEKGKQNNNSPNGTYL